jgi:gliding motility-associated-like protein
LPGTSNNGITGTWSPAVNNQQTTTYTFTPTAGQCANTAQMTVVVEGLILVCTVIQDESTPGANDGIAEIDISGGYPNYMIALSGPLNQTLSNQLPGTYLFDNLPPGVYSILITDSNGCTSTCNFIINPSGCQLSIVVDDFADISCFGGQDGYILLMASGQNGVVDYNWNGPVGIGNTNFANNLPAGTYMVTATDQSNCISTLIINLTQPQDIQLTCLVTAFESSPGANDGTVNITLVGGEFPGEIEIFGPVNINQPVSQEGSFDIQNLIAGTFDVIYTDFNGCQVFCQFEIEICAITVSITQSNNIACHGDNTASVSAFVNGQNGTLTIQWNQGLPPFMAHDNLYAGVYEITVSDEFGCQASDQITINEPDALSLICSSSPEQNGNDGIIHLQIQGGVGLYFIECTGPENQSFNNVPPGNFDITQLPSGNYLVFVTDENQCEISCSTTVQSMDCMIELTLTIQSEISCFGSFDGALLAEVNNATGSITYNWNGPVSISNQEPNPQNLPAGNYSLTVTDEDGCTATAQITILSPPGLSLSGTSLPESIPGANDGSFTLTINGGTPQFSMTYSGPQSGTVNDLDEGDITIVQLPPGTYLIIVTDANGCTESLEIVVRPAACNLGLILTIQQRISCHGANDGALLAQVSNFSGLLLYDWFGPVSIPDSVANPQNLSPGTYMLTVVDEQGCTATASVLLQEPLELEFRCSSIPVSAQGMSDGSLIVNITGGTINYIVQYSGPVNGSEIYNTPGVFPIAGLPVGNYSILVTDANGCTATCETTISNPGCTLFLLGSFTPPTCHGGNNGRIRIIPNGAVGNVSYTWVGPFDPGNVDDSNMLPAGFYIISGVDEAFCTDTFRITLTQPDPIILNCVVDEHESAAGAMDGQITFSWINGNAPYRYIVNGPAGSSESITSNLTATVNQLGAGNYTILVTDARGCTATCELIIQSGDCTISATLQQESEINCFGGNEASVRAIVQNASGTLTYQWDPNLGNSPLITDLLAGVYALTVVDNEGCSAQTSITITQPNPITLLCSASPSSGPTSPNGVLIFNTGGGVGPYLIEWNGPQTGTEIDNAGTTTIYGVLPGNYTVILTDANGCTSTCNVVVPSAPCNLNLNCQITRQPTEGESDGQALINWNSSILVEARLILPDGSEITENLSNSWFIRDLAAGIHTIIIRDANGCIDTCQFELIGVPCQLVVTELFQTPKCHNSNDGSINIIVTQSGGNPQILWNDGSVSFNRNNLSHGTWSYTVTDMVDCVFEGEIVLQNPQPLLVQGLNVLAGNCSVPLSSIFIENIIHANLPLVLLIGSVRYDVLSFPFLSAPTASGNYTINITDSNGCTVQTEVSINSFTPLRLAPMGDILVRPGETIFQQLILIGEENDLEYVEIRFNGQLICQNCLDFSFIAQTDGQFTARIRDIFGCEHEISWNLRVVLDQFVFIPGIFTPNRDGINDVFRVFGNDNIAMIDEFEIFNRWGDRVFSAYNIDSEEMVGWDGTFNGARLNPAVFVYKILITFRDGRTKLFAGEVVLAE